MESSRSPSLPRRILLATDLSGRCDRALDRAAQLAAQWRAKLVVVHALEWDYQAPAETVREVPSWRRDRNSRAAVAERQIHEDLLDHNVPFEVVIEEGEPSALVLNLIATSSLPAWLAARPSAA
jgi:nucleotide-binding universal stress UspA family protein